MRARASMMTLTRALRLLVLVIFVVMARGAAPKASQNDRFIFGAGALSCGQWTSKKPGEAMRISQTSWIQGFLSASSNYVNIRETDFEALNKWVDQYCTQHPLDNIDKTAFELLAALRVK